MADRWRECSLADLIEIKHGFAFSGEFIHDEPRGDVLLTPGNFEIGGGFKANKFKYYDGPIPADYVLEKGDLIVTMTDLSKESDTLGFPALVPSRSDGRRYLHNQRLGKVEIKDESDVDAKYLHYLLCTREYRNEVLAGATGTAIKHTSPDRILRFRFYKPSLAEQRRIAHILGTLDDKIELNRRMNETLEAMARALFKSWFVDFDPVRAKMDGRRPVGMNDGIAEMFPSALAHGEVVLPQGWSNGRWGDLADLEYGKSLRGYQEHSGRYPVYGTNGAIGLCDEFLCEGPGIVIGRKGAYRGVHYSEGPFFVIDTAFYLRPSSSIDIVWAYHELLQFDINRLDSGSAIPSTSREDFYRIPVVVPPEPIQAAFGHAVRKWFEKVRHNKAQESTLCAIRDTLLPRLLNCEVKVEGADPKKATD